MHSILGQGYPNLEYIVLDGGSTDNSKSLIHANADKLTYWRSCQDRGQYPAVEEGFQRATGEIMAWLNADDLYLNNCLFKVAMLFLIDPEVEWITGRAIVANDDNNITFRSGDFLWPRTAILSARHPMQERYIGQDAVFWRRSLWERAGSRLDHRFSLAADFELWVRFARHAVLHSARDEFSAFRFHGDQRSVQNKTTYLREVAAIIEEDLARPEWQRPPQDHTKAPRFLPLPYVAFLPPAPEVPLIDRADEPVDLDVLQKELTALRSLLADTTQISQAFHMDEFALNARLESVADIVQCISVDCFDTLLFRLSDEPTRLFIELGRRLLREGLLPRHISPEEFRVLRQIAEGRARQDSLSTRGTIECTIEEIYARLKHLVSDTSRAVDIELDTEQDFCYLNQNIASLLYNWHIKGKKIILLSDTYLSGRQISAILKKNGFNIRVVTLIITSRDTGVSKAEGKLFKLAAEKLGLHPQQICHLGDNYEVDVVNAEKAGWLALPYPRSDAYINKVMWREQQLVNTSLQAASLGSFRVLARRNGAAFSHPWRGYFQDGAFLFGPPLARFADWVVAQCRNAGIHRALLFMREAHTLLPLVRNSAKAADYDLELHPFYVSRHSVNLASLIELAPHIVYDKLKKHRGVPIGALLRTFELDPAMTKGIDADTLTTVPNDLELFTLAKLLCSHPVYSRTLKTLAKEKRRNFLGYAWPLLEGDTPVAVVDIGFRGTIQRYMEDILSSELIKAKITGLYFCTDITAAEKVINGSDIRSYLGGLGARQQDMLVMLRHPEILEQAVNATCGSTLGYARDSQGNYKPVLEDLSVPFEQIRKRTLIQHGIQEFQRIWLEFQSTRKPSPGEAFPDEVSLREMDREVVAILRRLWSFPLPEEAERLGSLFHDDNNGTDTGDIICSSRSREVYRKGGFNGLAAEMAYWPQGVVGLESPELLEHILATKKRFELP